MWAVHVFMFVPASNEKFMNNYCKEIDQYQCHLPVNVL